MKKVYSFIFILAFSLSFVVSAPAEHIVPAMPTDDVFPYALVDSVFQTISGRTFIYESGAGGWSTRVEMLEDGYFEGSFHDSDMGDVGEGYPQGTLYTCDFSGRFILSEAIDEYTFELRLAELTLETERGTQEVIDGVNIIATDAHGISGGDVFMLFFADRETQDMPEDYIEWIKTLNGWEDVPDKLPFYGLYNVRELQAFYSCEEVEDD